MNPEPKNEHLGDDDLGVGQPNVEPSDDLHEVSSSDSEYDHDSDFDYEDDEGDEMMQDIVPPHNPEVVYEKDDLPMAVGTIYPSMSELSCLCSRWSQLDVSSCCWGHRFRNQ